MQRLVDDGWDPRRSTDPTVVSKARVLLHGVVMGDRLSRKYNSEGHVAPAAVGVGDDGCLQLTRPTVVDLQVKGAGSFVVNSPVEVTWTDLRGTDERLVQAGKIGFTRPAGKATLTVRTFAGAPTTICSLVPVGKPRP